MAETERHRGAGGGPIPIYCPHKGCRYDTIVGGAKGEGFLAVHLRVSHGGVDPRNGDVIAKAPSVRQVLPATQPRTYGGRTLRTYSRAETIALIQKHAREHDGIPPISTDWKSPSPDRPSLHDVKRMFDGKWANAVVAAGFPRPVPGGGRRTATKASGAPEQAKRSPRTRDKPSPALPEVSSDESGSGEPALVPAPEHTLPVPRPDGLTAEEGEVMDHLVAAVAAFGELESQHPNETPDFVDGIHRCQYLLAMRVARRVYPIGWPVKTGV